MIVITGAQRNSSIGRTSGNTRLSTGSMGSLYWHLAQLMWEDSSRETASVIVLTANYYPSLVYNLCYKTHPVRLYSAFPCSPHTLLSGRFECVCLSVHEGSSTAGNTWGRQKSLLFTNIPDTISRHKYPVTWRWHRQGEKQTRTAQLLLTVHRFPSQYPGKAHGPGPLRTAQFLEEANPSSSTS